MSYENFRLIARLDIKGPNLIKGINLEGLRVVGDPNTHAVSYYEDGIDEIIYIDCVASLYGRNQLSELLKKAVEDVFVPITAGGGIRTLDDARVLLRSGADKIAVNTAAVADPNLISELAREFGSQCVVSYIEAKKNGQGGWEVFVENGRQRTYMDVTHWATECAKLGAGEILLTSIDKEGTLKGFDIDLCSKVSSMVDIPVIASGGMGVVQDIIELKKSSEISGVAIAGALHYKKLTVNQIRKQILLSGIQVRNYA
jgi:cyclase